MKLLTAFAFVSIFIVTTTVSHAGADRRGLLKFEARYTGGFNIVDGESSDGGSSKVIIRSKRDGESGRIVWTNVFYDETGARSSVRTVWTLFGNATFGVNSLDPRVRSLPGVGNFSLKNRRITFEATDGTRTATGTVRLVGGGALTIEMKIDGAVIEFHGDRNQHFLPLPAQAVRHF